MRYNPRTARAPDEWDNRLCGRPTKSGKRCRAHAAMGYTVNFRRVHLGCYLHDPRRRTHAENREAENAAP
jgi:hypothetical protein